MTFPSETSKWVDVLWEHREQLECPPPRLYAHASISRPRECSDERVESGSLIQHATWLTEWPATQLKSDET